MTESTTKPLVLIVSGAGRTGVSVLTGLAKSGAWRLAVTVRPDSIDKPEVALLRGLGIEVRATDWQKDGPARLDEVFSDADIVISTCNYMTLADQNLLVDASKRTNVKRFIPCDFGTTAPRGIMALLDTKLKVRDYIKEQGVPYTFIDVGFWMEISLPPRPSSTTPDTKSYLRGFYGDGETKSGLTNKDHIGDFVACIIADPRTLNRYVYVHEVEVTQNEIYDICGRIAGEDFHKFKEPISGDELLARAKSGGPFVKAWAEYHYSMYIRGDNCAKSAKSLGALDVKELYPDMKYQSLAEFAEGFYAA